MGYCQGFHALEMPGVSLASVLRMEESPQRLMHRLVLLFHPSNYELAISRLKRSEVVVIMASCIFELHKCDQHFCHQIADVGSHTPLIPLHWSFYPWSNVKALENVQMNAWSFLFTFPTGVSPVWCWFNDKQSTLCGTSSVLLFWVSSSMVAVVHQAHLACTTIQRWVSSVGGMRKSWFQWRTHQHPVHWFSTR